MASLSPSDIRILEQIRQRLSQLTESLNSLNRDIHTIHPLPSWYAIINLFPPNNLTPDPKPHKPLLWFQPIVTYYPTYHLSINLSSIVNRLQPQDIPNHPLHPPLHTPHPPLQPPAHARLDTQSPFRFPTTCISGQRARKCVATIAEEEVGARGGGVG